MVAFRTLALGAALAAAPAVAALADVPAGGVGGLDLYNHFRQQGVTLVSPPSQPVVMISPKAAYDGHPMGPDPEHALLVQTGGNGRPCDYTLGFDHPVRSVSFDRVFLHAGVRRGVHPRWTVTAFGDEDRPINSAGEPASRRDAPARHFTLNGPGILRLVFWGESTGGEGVCNVVIDSLYAEASPPGR